MDNTRQIVRLTEQEQDQQILANKTNIESQIALTNKNTTDINELDGRMVIIEENQAAPIGNINDLETVNKDTIVGSINEVNAIALDNKAVNEAQTTAIQGLAGDIEATTNVHAEVSTSGTISSTTTFVNGVGIEEPSTNEDLLTITEKLGYTEFWAKGEGRVQFTYKFNATKLTGNNPEVKVEMFDTETSEIIKEDIVTIGFGSSETQTSGIGLVAASVANKKLALRVSTVTDPESVSITSATIYVDIFGAKSVISGTTDVNVSSTNNLGGATNVQGDIAYLNTNKANQSDLANLQQQVNDIEVPDLTPLEDRVSANEDSIVTLNGKVSTLEPKVEGKLDKVQGDALGTSGTVELNTVFNDFEIKAIPIENETNVRPKRLYFENTTGPTAFSRIRYQIYNPSTDTWDATNPTTEDEIINKKYVDNKILSLNEVRFVDNQVDLIEPGGILTFTKDQTKLGIVKSMKAGFNSTEATDNDIVIPVQTASNFLNVAFPGGELVYLNIYENSTTVHLEVGDISTYGLGRIRIYYNGEEGFLTDGVYTPPVKTNKQG